MGVNVQKRLASRYYELAEAEKDLYMKFHLYWQCFNYLVESEKEGETGLRQGIRDFIADHYDEIDASLDFDDERLDEFFISPVFEDGRFEKEHDLYFYLDYNTSRVQYKYMNDYESSIRNFQKLYNDIDINVLFMTILKVYELIFKRKEMNYTDREERLTEASIYALKVSLDRLIK